MTAGGCKPGGDDADAKARGTAGAAQNVEQTKRRSVRFKLKSAFPQGKADFVLLLIFHENWHKIGNGAFLGFGNYIFNQDGPGNAPAPTGAQTRLSVFPGGIYLL